MVAIADRRARAQAPALADRGGSRPREPASAPAEQRRRGNAPPALGTTAPPRGGRSGSPTVRRPASWPTLSGEAASVLAGGSSEDFAALADAARFRNQDGLARRVLLAQRHRFPGTLRAEEASFLLGRLAMARADALPTRSPGTTATCAKRLPARMRRRPWGG